MTEESSATGEQGMLTQSDFEPRLGTSFTVESGGVTVDLRLAEISALRESGRPGGSFRLEFHGPMDAVLPQAIYAFDLAGTRHDIFVVPNGPSGGHMLYEALFL